MRRVKFPLLVRDGYPARDLTELREHFDVEKLYEYLCDGRLLSWLADRQCEEAKKIKECTELDENLAETLCLIFQVKYKDEYSKKVKALQKARINFILVGRETTNSEAILRQREERKELEDRLVIDETEDEESSAFETIEKYGSHGNLEEIRITEVLKVEPERKLLLENKKIIIANKIEIKENAKLTFQNCDIFVDLIELYFLSGWYVRPTTYLT